jgi:uncharacterized protein YoxC
MNWYEISAISAAAAFVMLVIYAIWTLHRARALMRKIEVSIAQITHTVDETTRLSRQLMRAMRGMIDDLQVKSREMQVVYDSVIDLGKSVRGLADLLRRTSEFLSKLGGHKPSSHSSMPKQGPKDQADSSRSEASGRVDWMQMGFDCFRQFQELYCKQLSNSEQIDRNKKE